MKKLIILPVIFMLLFAFCQSKEEKAAKEALINAKKQTASMADIKAVGVAIESYLSDNYTAPEVASLEEMKKLVVPFYIQKIPTTDPWGNEYHYKHGTGDEKTNYWIASAGPDEVFEDFQKTGDDIVFQNGDFL